MWEMIAGLLVALAALALVLEPVADHADDAVN